MTNTHLTTEQENPWRTAVLDALSETHMDAAPGAAPGCILARIIKWHADLSRQPIQANEVSELAARQFCDDLPISEWHTAKARIAATVNLWLRHPLVGSDPFGATPETNAATQEKSDSNYITAEQAKALGAGNAELFNTQSKEWEAVENPHYCYPNREKYRAIQAEPAEPLCTIRHPNGKQETMTREAAKNLFDKTTSTNNWFLEYESNGQWRSGDCPKFDSAGGYFYKLKPKAKPAEPQNQVKLDGELITREAAITRYEACSKTHDRYYKSNHTGEDFIKLVANYDDWNTHKPFNSEYQLCPKPTPNPAATPLDPALRESIIGLLKELGVVA